MRRWLIGIVVLALVAGTSGTAVLTDRSEFCGDCHSMQRVHTTWQASVHSHPAEGRPKAECVDCHIRWTAVGFAEAKLHGVNDVLAEYTHPTAWTEVAHPRLVFSENCRQCHAGIDKTETLARDRLPAKIRDIGLRGPHWIHFLLAQFTPDRAARLAALRAKKGPSVAEEKEQAWLEKSERANCAQCHERERTSASGERIVDPRVSQDSRNPLTDCMTCHVDVAHPRDAERGEAVPSFETCRQCHNGTYHGVLGYVFPADCDKKPNVALGEEAYCMKCHPGYKVK